MVQCGGSRLWLVRARLPEFDLAAMHRALPTVNKLLSKKWEEKQKAELQRRIKTVKPSIDNKPPRQYTHLRANMKRAQMEEERYSAIEKHNRMLLAKMERIMKQKGTLDNHTEVQAKSLNFFVRKKEMIRITSENLVRRLVGRSRGWSGSSLRRA